MSKRVFSGPRSSHGLDHTICSDKELTFISHVVVSLHVGFCFYFSDGKISLQEMISAVRRLKDAPSEAKCQKIADMLDQDHDGALDLVDVGTVSNRKL